MKVKDLIEELDQFPPDAHILLGEEAWSYVPEIKMICGKSERYTVHYCVREPGHEGQCYCSHKHGYFSPDFAVGDSVKCKVTDPDFLIFERIGRIVDISREKYKVLFDNSMHGWYGPEQLEKLEK